MGIRILEWSPEYQAVGLDAVRIVQVKRSLADGDDVFSAVLICASETARLYLVIHDLLIADGATLVSVKDIDSETSDVRGEFVRSVVKAKLAGKQPLVPKLDAATFQALCQWLLKAGVMAAFHEERTDDAGCQIGRVTAVTSEGVVVETVTPSGESGGPFEFAFEDLTRVDCLGEYERSFDLSRTSEWKNIQIIDGADNATFSLFQATDDEFAELFVDGADMEIIEDVFERLGDDRANQILSAIWERPILKREANGLHGTLFYDWIDRRSYIPATKREVDLDELSINEAQRVLFRSKR